MYDVAIVGGGIVGLATAYEYLKKNPTGKLIPEIESNDLIHGGSGVRAQALTKNGKLLDDFFIIRGKNITHVLNAPSPAATSAFAIAEHIVSVIES